MGTPLKFTLGRSFCNESYKMDGHDTTLLARAAYGSGSARYWATKREVKSNLRRELQEPLSQRKLPHQALVPEYDATMSEMNATGEESLGEEEMVVPAEADDQEGSELAK
uniref:Uncharacterized protein n=1 Tax=Tanacetum cinerariifolium TaxID=118510 RepID=A0A6L2NYD5_TANCI|nr:hypothetical protein [Tanacetum cinerariifolium]